MERGVQQHSKRIGALHWLVVSLICLGTFPHDGTSAIAATNPDSMSHPMASRDLSAFTKWTGLIPRFEAQRLAYDGKCINSDCANLEWERLLTRLADVPMQRQMREINRFFNAMPYRSDQDNYGLSDYWQTPYELMERGGDCEDYAAAKYLSLRRLGIPEGQLRVMVVKDQALGGTIHAVLEVRSGGKTYLLDNQEDDVLPAEVVERYSPMFSINESSWWAYK